MSSAIDISNPSMRPAAPAPATVAPARPAFKRAARAVPPGRITSRRVAVTLLLVLLGVYACRDAWGEIFVDYAWGDEEYSHVLIAPFVAALLVYVRRLRWRHLKVGGTPLGPLVVLTGLTMLFVGFHADRPLLFHASPIFVAVGCLISVLGKGVLFRFGPAVGALLFMIPAPGHARFELAAFLQARTAELAHALLDLIGFSTRVIGNTVSIRDRTVMIAEACNGMRSVFMLMLLAYAFVFALPLRAGTRIALLLISPLVALVCNLIRMLPTILSYGYFPQWFGPERGLRLADDFHAVAGYAMYAIAFLIWLGIAAALRRTQLPVQRFTLASQGG